MPKVPELVEMLEAGIHFGHIKSKRHPKMNEYIYTHRNGIHIIDLEQTAKKLKSALDFVTKVVAGGGVVMFATTKKQAVPLVEKYAIDCQMPYIVNRWLGGTLTNFNHIIKLPKKLKDLENKVATGQLSKYTKKEQLTFKNEIVKLKGMVEGMKTLEKLPEAIFVCDLKKDKTAVAEAAKVSIPVISLSDTNTNPLKVAYAIPANDDAVKSLEMIISLMAEAVKEGQKMAADKK